MLIRLKTPPCPQGYWLPRMMSFSERVSRTVSIETGMQSAALGFALSRKHFTDPLTALPSAVSIGACVDGEVVVFSMACVRSLPEPRVMHDKGRQP